MFTIFRLTLAHKTSFQIESEFQIDYENINDSFYENTEYTSFYLQCKTITTHLQDSVDQIVNQ